jgi:uncharacterized membrane protein YgcG
VRYLRRALVATLVVAAAPAVAQARTMHWKSLAVTARLDADGVLHVRERHHVVMSGDWNGGSRDFRLEPTQQIQLERMVRIEPATGARRPMVDGALDRVDGYGWTGPATLRWRSRLPADPPFDRTELVHELEYRLRGVVETDGSGYVLEHDFAFEEREGDILSHVVELDVDPAWTVASGPPHVRVERGRLRPGQGNVVRVELDYAAAGAPAHAVSTVRARRLLLALLLVPAALFAHFLLGEWRRGRFAPVTADVAAGAGFLEQHLLTVPAEVAGAAWDDGVGPPEVAALVARLAAEGALKTRSEDDVLHLELTTPRESLDDYERALVDGFFFDGRTATSTSEVRAHYRKPGAGFYPDAVIRSGVAARVAALVGPRPPWWPQWILPAAVLLAAAVVILTASTDGFVVVAAAVLFALPALVFGLAGMAFAGLWRDRVDYGLRDTPWFLVPAGILMILGWAVVGDAGWPLDAISRAVAGTGAAADALRLASVLVVIGCVSAILANARSRDSAAGLALRKRLAAARAYFDRELDRETPALRDEWFPYVLAFGLDDSSRRWFERYGEQKAARSSAAIPMVGSGSSWSGSGTAAAPAGPTPWTGGGGAFGGAGASASWAQAAHTLSAGVAPPAPVSSGGSSGGSSGSSGWRSGGSSSGSSGSGGSRSGGGGGGGW